MAKACLSPHHFSFLCPPQLGLSQPPPHRCPARPGSWGREVGGRRKRRSGWNLGSLDAGLHAWRRRPSNLPHTPPPQLCLHHAACPWKGLRLLPGFHREGPLLLLGGEP